MMDTSSLIYFLLASVLLTLAPGPDNMYLLAKSLADGARCGIALAGGLASGIVFHTALVIFGVAALVKSSPLAFAALKYVGAAYLLYLAWGAFRSASDIKIKAAAAVKPTSCAALYRRGIMMNVLNPKVLLFFLAFLPQFVSPAATNASQQIALLGALFSLQAFIIFAALAVGAGKVRRWLLGLNGLGKLLGYAQGVTLVFIAAAMLLG